MKGGVRHFIFSSTAAVYGNPARVPVAEDDPTVPLSPYGWSKLMTEQMLRDASAAHPLTHVALRYFNVAGADPDLRTGLQTPGATHLIKVAVEAALGRRERIDVYGTDYDTPDGTCIRDFIHVSDLARAHRAALGYLRAGNKSATLNCGYGRGYSIREVLDAVERNHGRKFPVNFSDRRPGDIVVSVAAADRIRRTLDWIPEFESLDTIVRHALAWEHKLMARAIRRPQGRFSLTICASFRAAEAEPVIPCLPIPARHSASAAGTRWPRAGMTRSRAIRRFPSQFHVLA